jgi:2,4-dienoyl-CoA reductase-like NADH-dependent reductase (Old Yellow Enzyme family)
VRAGVDVPVLVRFSGTDWVDGGWDEHQTATVAHWALEAGADLFDISSGGLVRAPIPVGPGYQVPLAAHVRSAGNVPVNAVGLITTAEQAEEILRSGQADAIMMGREFMRDPHAPLRFARELGVEFADGHDIWPQQYVRAKI